MLESQEDDRWRVVVFTTSDGAYGFLEALLEARGHQIVGVVTTPGPKSRRTTDYLGVVAVVGADVDVIVSTRPGRWAEMITSLRPDLIISVAFPLRIPAEVIAVPRFGAINGHDALLPKYRGPNPQGWVFRNGDTETGYTVHRLVPEFDAGPILAQVRVPVAEDDDFNALFERLMPLLPDVFTTALDRVARGEEGEAQDESLASPAPFFEESWRTIDWRNSARVIHNQVRSLFGLPGQDAGALATIDGQAMRVLKTKLVAASPGADVPGLKKVETGVLPGTVVGRNESSLLVMCADGPISVIHWQQDFGGPRG